MFYSFNLFVEKYTWSERFHQGAHAAYRFLEVVSSLVWRLLEIHMIKISMITIVVCSIVEVSGQRDSIFFIKICYAMGQKFVRYKQIHFTFNGI